MTKVNEQGFSHILDLMVADLTSRGVSRRGLRPLMYRIAWGLGLQLPPPLFQPWAHVFFITAIPVIALMLLAKWLLSSTIAVALCILVGMGMGAALAAYYQKKRESIGLPTWDEYVEQLTAQQQTAKAKASRNASTKSSRRKRRR